jgi:hypothetical protein
MSDDARTPQTPDAPGNAGAQGATPPAVGRDAWAGRQGETGTVGMDKEPEDAAPGGAMGETGATRPSFEKPSPAGGPAVAPGAEPGPWAAPADAPTPGGPGGPGGTLASNEPPAWPAPSVHDQRTVTSMPATHAPDATPPNPAWANPAAAPAHGTANPFAAPGPSTPANPFAAPGSSTPANPFAPPAAPTPTPYSPDATVPPPPIAPDGPGQVPYGYPGVPGGYGYPTPSGYGGHGPQTHGSAGYYGWPGLQPMPSNGMGTASLVVGIISAVIFCLWPIAIILGMLALIFGTIGRGKARRGEATNPGQALAGIICGAVGLVLGLGMLAFVIATA